MAGRLAIPVHSPAGELLAYAGRSLDQDPEYKYPQGFHRELEIYNLHRATASPQNDEHGLILVADILEVWELYETGRHNAVALMDTDAAPEQLELVGVAVGASGKVTLAQPLNHETLVDFLLDAGLWISWQDFSFASRHRKAS